MLDIKTLVLIIFYFVLLNHFIQPATTLSRFRRWNGKWFPHTPGALDTNPDAEKRNPLYDFHHGIKMGIPDPHCDDAKTNLTIDWDMNPINYTCPDFQEKLQFRPKDDVSPLYSASHIPQGYSAPHFCMDEKINYDEMLPTFGPHRPLWAKYGQYKFLPRQRWLHNLEHGAIVMLYHPCANKNEVNLLKQVVTHCLYRYIITPYNLLPPERPIALVSWGHRLLMSKVDLNIAADFIRKHALKGAEQTSSDGHYDQLLEEHATFVSDEDDTELCKNLVPSKITE